MRERERRRARKVDCGQVGFPFYYKISRMGGGSRKEREANRVEDILRCVAEHGLVVGRKINFSLRIGRMENGKLYVESHPNGLLKFFFTFLFALGHLGRFCRNILIVFFTSILDESRFCFIR